MSWIVLFAWLGALVIAAVVLGFCAYELFWKMRRLGKDLQALQGVGVDLAELQDHVAAAIQRLARAGAR